MESGHFATLRRSHCPGGVGEFGYKYFPAPARIRVALELLRPELGKRPAGIESSCVARKTKGVKVMAGVLYNDDLTAVFSKIEKADAIILGSPIYFGNDSGEFRSFMERLMFPYLTYTNPPQSLFPRRFGQGLSIR